jgi:hypothetical protein
LAWTRSLTFLQSTRFPLFSASKIKADIEITVVDPPEQRRHSLSSSAAAAADDRLLKDSSDLWLPLPPDKVPPSDLIALGDSGVRKCMVLRSVADPGSLSRIQGQKDPGSGSASKNLSIFNPKNCF